MSNVTDKDEVFLNIASTLAQLGTCPRRAVGAVIVRQGRCITWGYNGAPPGLPHCDENDHGYRNQELLGGLDSVKMLEALGCRNATHAEANAIAFAARSGISTEHGTLYCGISPCHDCAKLIIAAGIRRVVCGEMYRDESGAVLLFDALIPIDVQVP